MSLLKVEGLVKTYGRRRVVDGIDFEVADREIVGLLGPNGAGKTTSFRMTCGMVEPDAGRVLLHDMDVTSWPMFRRARDGGMGYLAQEQSVFRKLSVEDNISSVLQLLGVGYKQRKQQTEELLERFKITKIRKSKAQYISGGEKRRLEIARCLVSNPQIILLDEPFTGIDPDEVLSNPAARKYYFGDTPALGVGRPMGGPRDGGSPHSPNRPTKPRRRTA